MFYCLTFDFVVFYYYFAIQKNRLNVTPDVRFLP